MTGEKKIAGKLSHYDGVHFDCGHRQEECGCSDVLFLLAQINNLNRGLRALVQRGHTPGCTVDEVKGSCLCGMEQAKALLDEVGKPTTRLFVSTRAEYPLHPVVQEWLDSVEPDIRYWTAALVTTAPHSPDRDEGPQKVARRPRSVRKVPRLH